MQPLLAPAPQPLLFHFVNQHDQLPPTTAGGAFPVDMDVDQTPKELQQPALEERLPLAIEGAVEAAELPDKVLISRHAAEAAGLLPGGRFVPQGGVQGPRLHESPVTRLVEPQPRSLAFSAQNVWRPEAAQPQVQPVAAPRTCDPRGDSTGAYFKPEPFGTKTVELGRDNSAVLKLKLRVLCQAAQSLPGNGTLRYPKNLVFFITDPLFQVWADGYINDSKLVFSESKFIEDATAYLCGEVRSAESIALDEMLSGSIKQGDSPVSTYAERFMQRSRVLVSESQVSLCRHYLAGLTPELRTRCMLDRDNHEWRDLHSLIQFSFGEELRCRPSRAVFSRPSPVPHRSGFSPSPKQGSPWTNGNKRARNEGGPSLAVAAAGPANRAANPGNKVAKVYDQSSPRNKPVELCPRFKYKGALTPEVKSELSAWGLCWYCRAGRHPAQRCPEKTEPQHQQQP